MLAAAVGFGASHCPNRADSFLYRLSLGTCLRQYANERGAVTVSLC